MFVHCLVHASTLLHKYQRGLTKLKQDQGKYTFPEKVRPGDKGGMYNRGLQSPT